MSDPLTQITDVATIIADVAVFVGIAVAYVAFRADQRDRRERDAHRRIALDTALRHELQQVQKSAELDIACFRPETQHPAKYAQHPAVKRARANWEVQKGVAYRRTYTWTPLVSGAINQAIREASSLRLSSERIRDLSNLFAAIVRVNARIASKNALLSAVVGEPRPTDISLTYSPGEWASIVADQLNGSIEPDLNEIGRDCSQILGAIEAAAGETSGRR